MHLKHDISKKLFWGLVIGLIILRIIAVILLFFDIPPADFDANNFTFRGTGDEVEYFAIAKNLSQFKIEPTTSQISIGLPLYLTPFILITGAQDFYHISQPAFIVMAFILASLSIILVVLIARILLKNKLLAILIGTIYLFYPYLLYFMDLGPYQENLFNFTGPMWLSGAVTDSLSALLIYLAIYLFLRIKESPYQDYILTGLATGLAILVRVTNLIFAVIFGIYLLFQKKVKELIILTVTTTLVFSLQIIYNIYAHGQAFNFGYFNPVRRGEMLKNDYYLYQAGTIAKLEFTPHNYLYFLTVLDKYIPYLPLVLFFIITFLVIAFWYIYQTSKKAFYFLLLWIVPFAAFYASFQSAARNARYWMPIIPALIIVFIYGILACKYIFQKYVIRRK